MPNLIYLVGLHSLGISQRKLSNIFEKKDNYKEFYEKLSSTNLKPFCSEKEITIILSRKDKINLEKITTVLKERNVELITIKDDEYPNLLKQISNPPYLLYVRGKIDNSPKIVIIGSRNMTSYGKKVIEKIVPGLTRYFTIVSGGAMGCDSEGHIQTLINNGKTIAVIGTGIDLDYPSSNKKLFDNIVEKNGGIISIFPIGEIPNNYNFPIRNEIVAGISSGVIVIESSEKSGTLITANLALEQGKDVFAVPGDIYKSNSIGCNNLIKNGNAKIVTTTEDILEEYNIITNKPPKNNNTIDFGNDIEKIIYDILLLESLDADELIQKTTLSLSNISINLSMLEIKGILKKSINGKYEII
ncbi:MAG: DNA-processing protein DprA [Candidatus Gracilibacteria bacterium]